MTHFVVYSKLCDTDPDLYRQYLFAVARNGGNSTGSRRVGSGRVVSRNSCGIYMGRIEKACGGSRADGGSFRFSVGAVCSGSVTNAAAGDTQGRSGFREGDACIGDNGLFHERSGSSNETSGVVVDSDSSGSGCVEEDDRLLNRRLLGPNGGISVGRGNNYERNQLRRSRRKKEKSDGRSEMKALGGSGQSSLSGAFVGCSDSLVKELRESRALMLIAKNRSDAAKADSQTRHYQMVRESRVDETKFELSRQSSEEKLRKISKMRLGAGFIEGTICSSAATPSLSSGSVSPNSSMSMAEVKRKDNLILDLERKLAEVTIESKSIRADRDKLASDVDGFVHREKGRRDAQRFRDDVAYQCSAPQFVQRHVPGEAPKSGVKGGNGYSQWD